MASGGFFFFFARRGRHTRLKGDWSSDVCSSDLSKIFERHAAARRVGAGDPARPESSNSGRADVGTGSGRQARGDRKSVVWGKSVDLGGRRIIKKKKSRVRSDWMD